MYTGRLVRPLVKVCFGLGVLFVLFFFSLGPIAPGNKYTWAGAQMGRAHEIGYLMLCYAANHNGKFPDGNSSTEVFQKLLDAGGSYGYPDVDSTIFYVPLSGKIRPVAGQKLKPENVCWDVTFCMDSSSSDLLPLVFLTGYKVTYVPGGTAVPIIKPYPPYTRIWSHGWNGAADPAENPGIAVCYKGNKTTFRQLYFSQNTDGSYTKNPDAVIPNFISSDFDAKGHTYCQLTPDGPLPGN